MPRNGMATPGTRLGYMPPGLTETLIFIIMAALGAHLSSTGAPIAREGAQIPVPAGANLQAAIDRAKPGDVLLLEPGATYVGNFTLPSVSGSQFITIRSAADPS